MRADLCLGLQSRPEEVQTVTMASWDYGERIVTYQGGAAAYDAYCEPGPVGNYDVGCEVTHLNGGS